MTAPQIQPHVRETLEYVSACYSTFKLTLAVAMVWQDQLGRFSREVLLRAIRAVCKRHTYGSPAPAHIVEQIEGRIERRLVPIEYPDGFGGTYRQLRTNGEPVSEWREVHLFPDGREELLALPAGDDLEFPCELDDRHGLGRLSDDLAWQLGQLEEKAQDAT